MKTCYYLFLDPGVSTGWASFDENADLLEMGITKEKNIGDLLKATAPSVMVYESFELRKNKAIQQSGSDMPAPRVIGMLQLFANMFDVQLHSQRAYCKESGYKWGGIPKAKNHKFSHDKDAYAHAVYYFISNKIKKQTHYIKNLLGD